MNPHRPLCQPDLDALDEPIGGNYAVALKAEAKKVVRCFQPYTYQQRTNHAASRRLGHQQRKAVGEFFYVHPAVPDRAFPTRGGAALAGLEAQ